MATLDTLNVPLSEALDLVPAVDRYVGPVLVARKGVPITEAALENCPGDPSTVEVLVRPPREQPPRRAGDSTRRKVVEEHPELTKTLAPKTVVFSEGENTCDIYILQEGKVAVYKGGELVAVIDRPGTFLGEMSSLLNQPRTASVVTLTESVFVCFPGHEMLASARDHPGVLLKLSQALARKVARTTEDFLTLHNIDESGEREALSSAPRGADEPPPEIAGASDLPEAQRKWRNMVVVALSDGEISPTERVFLEEQRQALGVEEGEALALLLEVLSRRRRSLFLEGSIEERTELFKDIIRTCGADGTFSEQERGLMRVVGAKLGLSADNIERLAE